MTLTQSSTRLAALTIGVAAIVAVAFSAAVAAPAHAASICPGATFHTNLKQGATNAAVMQLQQFLNMSADTQVAATGAGSPGSETSYFGALTKAAVNKFQLKYAAQILTPLGLSTPTGNFYAASEAEANAVCAGSTGTTGTTGGTTTGTASGTAVVAAAAQPANTIAPAGASRVPFTAFTVTANGAPVTVNSVTVQRQGPSVDTDFAGIVLIDASTGVQVGNSRVLDANHSATIGSPITIPAGTSKTFWVAANIQCANGVNGCVSSLINSGDIASFAVTAVNTASSVTGSYPITGASNTINASLVIGSATVQLSSFDPNNASTQPVGTTGYRFSGIRVNAGSTEDLTFKSITWYQAGSASGIANVMTVVNGTSYPTTMDSTGRYYTSVFPSGITIAKGNSLDAYVQADLTGNTTSGTTAEFDIYRNTDVYLVGNQYGFGITPTGTSFGNGVSGSVCSTAPGSTCFLGLANSTPWLRGSGVTITGGTFSTIQNASSVGAQNVAVNVNNQPLGGFQTNLTGEGVTAQTVKVHFTTSSAMAPLLNVSLVTSAGASIAGPYNATCDASLVSGLCTSTAQTVTFTGSIAFPVGAQTYTIQGEVPSGTTNGVTIQASTNPSTDWQSLTGNTTGNNVAINTTNFTMNTMTVQAASLTVANSNALSSQTIVAGGQNVALASIQLDASQSGENVRLNSLPINLILANFATTTDISNCQIWNGTTALNTGSRVINSANINGGTSAGAGTYPVSFSFDNSLNVPKGTVVNLSLTCSVTSSATAGATYKVTVGTPTATGATSGNTVTPVVSSASAATMTVANNASLVASTNSQSPAYSVAAGGNSGVTLNVITLRTTNEPVNLQKLALHLTSGSSADLSQVYIYAGNNLVTSSGAAIASLTPLGTASFTGGSLTSTSTLTTSVQIPNNGQDSTFIIKGDLADIGTNQSGVEGDLVAVDYNSARGTGASSGKTIDGSALSNAGVAGLRVYNTFPTLALGTLSGSGVSDGNLMRFTVTADSHGSLGLQKLAFLVTPSSGTTAVSENLYAYTDPGYSLTANTGNSGGVVGNASYSGNTVTVVASTTPMQVSAGQTIYFQLRGTVSGGSNSTYNVNTTLLGDSASVGVTNAAAQNTYNFVWSPNATSTALVGSGPGMGDFANGAGLPGLPSVGLSQNRTQ